jgi:hypothetical protein
LDIKYFFLIHLETINNIDMVRLKNLTKSQSIATYNAATSGDFTRITSETQDKLDNEPKETEIRKNKPGRPRKNPLRQPQLRLGLVKTPCDNENYVEFLYDNPERFKKIFSYFKSHAVNKIFITFKHNMVLFWCEDNSQKNKIRVKINCDLVNNYYCHDVLNIGVSCDHLEKIMATIDKTYSSILFLSRRDSLQNTIKIVLRDDSSSEESYVIELIEEYNTFQEIDHKFDEHKQYKLYFTLPSKKFKSMINNMSSFTDQASIELDDVDDPLNFKYTSRDNKIRHVTSINRNQWTLQKNFEDEETFRTSFIIDYVKAISTSLISDNIVIYVDEKKPLLFVNVIENGCIEVRTLTNIINNND